MAISPEYTIRSLAADETDPATMYDPALTYYADGTRVVMRARGEERRGVTFGRTEGGRVYGFQAVRWDDGGEDLVAPHVLSRDEEAAEVADDQDTEPAAEARQSFYVTTRNGKRTSFLLGPYDTHAEALDNVDRAQRHVMDRYYMQGSGFWGYGTTRVQMKPGAELPLGKLNDRIGLRPEATRYA